MAKKREKQRKDDAADSRPPKARDKGAKKSDGNIVRRFLSFLFEPEDAAYLAGWRVMWGLIMAYEAWTYIQQDYGKMYFSFYNSVFHFKYWGLEWTAPPGDPRVMCAIFWLMLFAGLGIATGFLYTLSSITYFVLFTYMFSLEQGVYLNHFYLVIVILALMIALPCSTVYSIDERLWPSHHSDTTPNAQGRYRLWIWAVRALLVVVYMYAGVAKINEDWLRGEPLVQWLAKDHSHLGFFGEILNRESTAYFMSYGGLVYDLIVGPLLLFDRTKWLGVALSLFFHLTNKLVMNIGIFPWFMIASTTFFFDPSWPRRFIAAIRRLFQSERAKRESRKQIPKPKPFWEVEIRALTIKQWLAVLFVLVFLIVQILVPLRLHLYEGDVKWTEYGHKFSWRMKLRTKRCFVNMFVYQPLYENTPAFLVPMDKFLPAKFTRKMSGRPDLIAQAGRYFGQFWAVNGTRAEIYVYSGCRLNGRPLQRLVNETVDFGHADPWTIPIRGTTELAPLKDEHKQGYPWNWEWNFNWLFGKDRNRLRDPTFWDEKRQEQSERIAVERNDYVHFFHRMVREGKVSKEYADYMVNRQAIEQPHAFENQPPPPRGRSSSSAPLPRKKKSS